jgi:hypothetical protein
MLALEQFVKCAIRFFSGNHELLAFYIQADHSVYLHQNNFTIIEMKCKHFKSIVKSMLSDVNNGQ